MKILDGKVSREYYFNILKTKVLKLLYIPHLVIIQVGERPDSDSYINAKKKFAQSLNIKVTHIKYDVEVSEQELLRVISINNKDENVNGIIVQLPLPNHLNSVEIIESIDPSKDVDGLTNFTKVLGATPRGISELLDFYDIPLIGKKVTVLGMSRLVGLPIANMCRERGAIVTSCNSSSDDVFSKSKNAEILIVAIGKPHLIDEKYVSKNQIIVDVGITKVDGVIYGDVNLEEVKNIIECITPVPGGVGQMTVLALFENLVDLCYNA